MGIVASACRRSAATTAADGEADWLITHIATIVDTRSLATKRVQRAVRKVLDLLRLRKVFAKLGRFLANSRNRHITYRVHVASSWSKIGKYLNEHKHIYRHSHGRR